MAPRKWLLTQNKELRPLGIYNWTIPALSATLTDGTRVKTCPNAGVCAGLCYARSGTYRWRGVLAAHVRNLEMVVNDLEGWRDAMGEELDHKRYIGKWVRIHDAGDFFSDDYTEAWLQIIRDHPGTTFYCYTREVSRFRRVVEPDVPENFLYLFSLGGKEDHLVDKEKDRHADVFPSLKAAIEAGYTSQHVDDRHCVTLPTNKIAVVVNRIPALIKKQGPRTFGELQIEQNAKSMLRGADNADS